LHADGSIVTNPGFHSIGIGQRLSGVYGETSGRGETGVKSDEDCLNGRPSLFVDRTRVRNYVCVEAVGNTIIPPLDCGARVRCEERVRGLQELTDIGNRRGVDIRRDGVVRVQKLKIRYGERFWQMHAVHPKQAPKEILRKEGVGE